MKGSNESDSFEFHPQFSHLGYTEKVMETKFSQGTFSSEGETNPLFTLSPAIKQLFFHFSRSRFLHVWSLENKRLLHVIQLPARVRLVRQLEFISNSFDGGSSQVSKQ